MAKENYKKSLLRLEEAIWQSELICKKIDRFCRIIQIQNREVQKSKIGKRNLRGETVLKMPETLNMKLLFKIQESIHIMIQENAKCKINCQNLAK